MSKKKDVSAALLGILVAAILWITILGREPQLGGNQLYQPFHSLGSIWKEIFRAGLRSNLLGNIILFIPVSALVSFLTGWEWKTVAVGSGFSFLVEIMQLITRRGCFDPDDVMLNVLGCVIGYGLYRAARTVFHKHSGKPSGTNV